MALIFQKLHYIEIYGTTKLGFLKKCSNNHHKGNKTNSLVTLVACNISFGV